MKSLFFFKVCTFILFLGGIFSSLHPQSFDGRTIVQKNDQQQKSRDEYSEMTMTLISRTGKSASEKLCSINKRITGLTKKSLYGSCLLRISKAPGC